MTYLPLAAIQVAQDDIDRCLGDIAGYLTSQGRIVRGVLQLRGDASGACYCADMDLMTIGSRRVFRISQPLGNGSRGCRLDPGALAECSAFLDRELTLGVDLLILNRFGRGESEGRGFRELIARALSLGVPVLTGLRPAYVAQWNAFSAGLGCLLPPDRKAILGWADQQMLLRNAA